ncbi:MAG: hypothetical protein GPOALKHO_000034 [Sodalis sp.]|nr:MAG: hypothetical protein GPOALKHO_000034 [Sodalis sp.]
MGKSQPLCRAKLSEVIVWVLWTTEPNIIYHKRSGRLLINSMIQNTAKGYDDKIISCRNTYMITAGMSSCMA